MRLKWFFTPAWYGLGLLAGILTAAILSGTSKLLGSDTLFLVFWIGYLAPPMLIFWLLLTTVNYWITKKNKWLGVFIPFTIGLGLVLFGFYVVLHGILGG